MTQTYQSEDMAYVERMIHETSATEVYSSIPVVDWRKINTTAVPNLKRSADEEPDYGPTVTTPFPAQALGAHAQDTGLKTKGW